MGWGYWGHSLPRRSGASATTDVTAVMSLLEGHADVVMDAVGPAVVPSVVEIREKFRNVANKGADILTGSYDDS